MVAASCVDLARSYVGIAVKAGAAHPDIATEAALRAALLAARSVAYSRLGASGILFAQLIERLGIAPDINARAVIIPQGFTAERLVTGEADLAVQQISELKQIAGIEVVGVDPARVADACGVLRRPHGRIGQGRSVRSTVEISGLDRRGAGASGVRAGALNLPALRRNLPVMRKQFYQLAIIAFAAAPPLLAHAQSADLVLCDRVAADPSDPDKPADVKGIADIAASDIATAIKYCRIAANSSRRAMYQLGRAYAANRQTAEAVTAWRKAADKGSTSAMVELGVLYGTGTGVARDEAQARKLFERAAEAGNPRGVSNLAALGGGAGASADPARARELLSKAAETNAEAQYQLGMMLAEGNGGTKDDVAARALFEKAAAQNHPGALERMGAFAQEGRGGAKDSDAAKAYYQRAAALGDEDAKKALERFRCPYAIKDKRGNVVTNLCF